MSKKKNSRQNGEKGIINQQLIIRKPRPSEGFYETGNVEKRYCLVTERRLSGDPDYLLSTSYHWLKEPALHATWSCRTPVNFHEAISETGERFAYPQSLPGEHDPKTAWKAAEREMLSYHGPYLWTALHYGEESGEYVFDLRCEMVETPWEATDFRELLDAALAPDAIDSLDHPDVRRVQRIDGMVELEGLIEWVEVA